MHFKNTNYIKTRMPGSFGYYLFYAEIMKTKEGN